MEQLDKNKSYFFLFESCDYTLDQVRSFSLEECCENCFQNDPYDEKYDLDEVLDDFNSYFTGESAEDGDWFGEGLFLNARIAPREKYRVFELKGSGEDEVFNEETEICLNDGRTGIICNDCTTEWGGIEFNDGSEIAFQNLPIEILEELTQKTKLVIEVSLQQFEEDWYNQSEVYGRFVAIKKCDA